MREMRVRLRKGSRGFTLIELLAVLLIIGVLAAIGVPRYFRSVERSRISEGIRAMKTIAEGANRWCLRNGTVPPVANLDVQLPGLNFFPVPTIAGTCNALIISAARNATQCLALAGCASGMGPIVMNGDGVVTGWGTVPVYLQI